METAAEGAGCARGAWRGGEYCEVAWLAVPFGSAVGEAVGRGEATGAEATGAATATLLCDGELSASATAHWGLPILRGWESGVAEVFF